MDDIILNIIRLVITAAVTWVLAELRAFLLAKKLLTNNVSDIESGREIDRLIANACSLGVQSAYQTHVVKHKKGGNSLTAEQGGKALEEALKVATSALVSKGIGAVEGATKKLLTDKIEAVVGASQAVKP